MAQETTDSRSALKKLSSLRISGEDYDLAKNGGHYHLVEHREPDAYLRPVARKVELEDWVSLESKCARGSKVQALLDIVGGALSRIAELEEELGRAHTALQREAEPEFRKPVKPRVEVQAGLSGVLESGKE